MYKYYRDSVREEVRARRGLLEEWFAQYPDEAKRSFLGRFRSKDDDQHSGAMWELVLFKLIRDRGCYVEVEPKTDIGSAPDFRIVTPSGEQFYLEACVLFESDPKQDRRKQIFLESLQDVRSKYFDLMVWENFSTFPKVAVSKREFVRSVQAWLGHLDWNEIIWQYDRFGGQDLPRKAWVMSEWEVALTAIPRNPSDILVDNDGVSRTVGIMIHENTIAARARDAIRKKAQRYRDLDAPLVVAVNVLKWNFDQDDIETSLFGADGVVYHVDPLHGSFVPAGEYRKCGDAVFRKNADRRCDHLVAVLFGFNIGLWNVASYPATLIPNPFSEWFPARELFEKPIMISSVGDVHYSRWDLTRAVH